MHNAVRRILGQGNGLLLWAALLFLSLSLSLSSHTTLFYCLTLPPNFQGQRHTHIEKEKNQAIRNKTRLFDERFQGRLPLAGQRHVVSTPVNMSTINQKLMAVAAIIRDLTMAAGEYYYY